jgi:hypothetical protein
LAAIDYTLESWTYAPSRQAIVTAYQNNKILSLGILKTNPILDFENRKKRENVLSWLWIT